MGAVDDLAVKLTRIPVKAHVRRTKRGAMVPVVAHEREWAFRKGDTVSLKGTNGMMRGTVTQLVENPSYTSYGEEINVNDLGAPPIMAKVPETGVGYDPGTKKYRVRWNNRLVGLYSDTELTLVPRRNRVSRDVTEEVRRRVNLEAIRRDLV